MPGMLDLNAVLAVIIIDPLVSGENWGSAVADNWDRFKFGFSRQLIYSPIDNRTPILPGSASLAFEITKL